MEKYTIKNIMAYIEGNTRYFLYYSRFKFLLSKHIVEQIDWRVSVMDKKCYEDGQCKMCGCETIHLQMANKACDKPCYPEMMKRGIWKAFKEGLILNKHKYNK